MELLCDGKIANCVITSPPMVVSSIGGHIAIFIHIQSGFPADLGLQAMQCWTAGAGDPIFLTTLFIAWHAGRWRAPAHNDMLLKSS